MSSEKTIRMPKKYLNKWLKALRSGGYEQAQGSLYKDGGFCCLGVLQHCMTGGVEFDEEDEESQEFPSHRWLNDYGISFYGFHGDLSETPYLPSLDLEASEANDEGDSFLIIADAIEQAAETY